MTRPPGWLAVVAVCSLVASGCAARLRADSSPPTGLDAATATYTTQVAVGQCALTPGLEAGPAAAIGGALLSSAIAEGINRIGVALEEAARQQSWTATAHRNVEVTSRTFGPCVQIVRGWFYREAGNAEARAAAAQAWHSKEFIDQGKFTLLWQNALWIAAPPDFVFEAALDHSENRRALTLVPRYARLDRPIATRWLRPSRTRHVAVFIAFHGPEEAVDVQTNPAAAFVLGRMEGEVTQVFPGVSSAGRTNRSPYESNWFTVTLEDESARQPHAVSAAVVETQEASQFLAFVAAVFTGAKTTITEQAQTLLVPEKAAAAREADRTARETLAAAYDSKLSAALTKVEECANPAAGASAQALAVGARTAMRELNQASRAAVKRNVFGEADFNRIKLGGNLEEVKAGCAPALVRLKALT